MPKTKVIEQMIRIEQDSRQMRFSARSLSLRKLISRAAFVYDVRRSTALKKPFWRLTMARLSNARFVSVLYAIVVINASISMAQTRRGVTPEDYFAFEFASDPNISPDGKLVAYVVTKIDRGQNRRTSSIWIAATDGSRAP